jgi:hypothetical protein
MTKVVAAVHIATASREKHLSYVVRRIATHR